MSIHRIMICGFFVMAVAFCTASAFAVDEGQADLDQATLKNLEPNSYEKLGKVIDLCQSAMDKGLSDQNETYATELMTSSLLQRAKAAASGVLRIPPSRQWAQLRILAIKDLERSIKLRPKMSEAHLLIARLQILPGGDSKKAMVAFELAIKHAPSDSAKINALLLRAAISKDEKKRLADYAEAIKIDTKNTRVLRNRARYLLAIKKHQEALNDADAVIKLDPKNADNHLLRGSILAEMDKNDEAKKSFDQAIKLKPKSVESYLQRSRTLAIKGELDNAVSDLTHALSLQKDNLVALLMRARIYQIQGKIKEGMADVDHLLRIRPGLIAAVETKADLLAADGKYELAITELEKLVAHDPKNMKTKTRMASIYSAGKYANKAIELYSEVLSQEKENLVALAGRANAYLSVSRHSEAVADYKIAYKLAPKNDHILNNYAWVLATSPDDKVRDGKLSVKLATEACEVTEYKQAHIISTLGAAYAEIGDWANAIKWSSKAVEIGQQGADEQLKKELESYRNKKAWREEQNVEDERKKEEAKNKKDNPKPNRKKKFLEI